MGDLYFQFWLHVGSCERHAGTIDQKRHYRVGTYPSLLAMQKLHMGRFLGVMTICWGASLLGMLAVKNFAGLAVCRFLLGLFESCLAPGFLQLTGRFYRQQEQPFRFGIWVC